MFSHVIQEGPENSLTIIIEGKLDTFSAPVIQEDIESYKNRDFAKVVFELSKVDYLASSGIRVIFFAKKNLGKNVAIELKGAQGMVAKVIQMSGLSNFVATVD